MGQQALARYSPNSKIYPQISPYNLNSNSGR